MRKVSLFDPELDKVLHFSLKATALGDESCFRNKHPFGDTNCVNCLGTNFNPIPLTEILTDEELNGAAI